MKLPHIVFIEDGEPAYMFPFDNIELNMVYSRELLEDFKKTQKIDTNALVMRIHNF